MKEYTILSALSVILAFFIDSKTKVKILCKNDFYLFLSIILFFMFLVNGYLTQKNAVIYNPDFFLNIRISSIPLEDFLFGFSMIALTIIFWEFFKTKFNTSHEK